MTNSEQHQPETPYSCGSDRLVPDFDFADVLNVPLDTTISLERCNIGYPFDELMMPCDGTGGGYLEIDLPFDSNECFMPSVNVKREMDFVEVITQSNNKT